MNLRKLLSKPYWFHIAILLFGLFLVMDYLVHHEIFLSIDETILIQVSKMRTPLLDSFFTQFTAIGSFPVMTVIYLIVALVMILNQDRLGLLHATVLFGGTGLLQSWVKTFYLRPRPSVVTHVVEVGSTSFPSGHAFAASSIFLTLSLFASQYYKKTNQRIAVFIFAVIVFKMIGFSRIYLGVHYPTDVLSGYFIGIAWSMLVAWVMNQVQFKYSTNAHKKN